MTENPQTTRPLTLLIAALGGEGGAVLTNWIVNAARRGDLPVQSTSIPGVAQRTGTTTYYIEIWPEPLAGAASNRPIMSLSPAPGEVDIVAATEMLEAGRCIANGFVTPDRTLLIASTHRVLTTREKMAMGDGRIDPDRLMEAAENRARDRLLLDLPDLATKAEAHLNSVMLGVIAGCGRLPIPPDAFAEGIRAEGKAVEANLAGFEAGLKAASAESKAAPVTPVSADLAPGAEDALAERARTDFPEAVQPILGHALARLVDYQDADYAALYLDRLMPFCGTDVDLLANVGRHLALRMTYEDIIRVAQLKAHPRRFARIRADVGAASAEPVAVVDFFKPRLAEVCDILPARMAQSLLAQAAKRPKLAAWQRAMQLKTTTVFGFLGILFLSRLKPWRRRSYRFGIEQRSIVTWLADIEKAAAMNISLAREISECAGLIKGYGDTHRRGFGNYARIRDSLIAPALDTGNGDAAAVAVARARQAALEDPAGRALDNVIGQLGVPAIDVLPGATAIEAEARSAGNG
jgi:indolepyruvate ferredoxin oxidoreductase, beta subunit